MLPIEKTETACPADVGAIKQFIGLLTPREMHNTNIMQRENYSTYNVTCTIRFNTKYNKPSIGVISSNDSHNTV